MKNFSKILALPIVAIGGSILLTNNANAALSQSVIDGICQHTEKVRTFEIDANGNSFVLFGHNDDNSLLSNHNTKNFLVKNGVKVGETYNSPSNSHVDISWPWFPFYEIRDGKFYDGNEEIPNIYIDGIEAKYDRNTMPTTCMGCGGNDSNEKFTIKNGKLYSIEKDNQGGIISETFIKDLGNNITFDTWHVNWYIRNISKNHDVIYSFEESRFQYVLYRNSDRLYTHDTLNNAIQEIITEEADIYVFFKEWNRIKIEKNGQIFAHYDIEIEDEEEIKAFFNGNDLYVYFAGWRDQWRTMSKWVEGIYKNGKPLCEKVATPHPLDEKIAKLPAVDTVTLANEAKITEIKKEFDALSAEDKKKISDENQKKLNNLIAKIAELKIADLNDKISKLPNQDTVKPSDKAEIETLKDEYDKLSETDKQKISEENRNKLTALINKIKQSNNSTSTTSSGGGVVYNTPNIPTNPNPTPKTETQKTENSTKLFPKFVAKKSQAVTDLQDIKLTDLNKRFGIVNEKTRNETLSRGEFLRIVLDSANVNLSSINVEKLTFADVGKNTEIAKYIAFARENNIISGYSDNTFRANATISRAEATKILIESLGVKLAEKNTTFADVTAENTLGKYIQTAYDNFLLNGTSKTTFEPNRSISRGELIKIIYNILN